VAVSLTLLFLLSACIGKPALECVDLATDVCRTRRAGRDGLALNGERRQIERTAVDFIPPVGQCVADPNRERPFAHVTFVLADGDTVKVRVNRAQRTGEMRAFFN
jgi:hypothetical protein